VDAIEYSSPAENNQEVHQQLVHKSKKDKIRRRTATPNELLYSLQMDSFPSANSLPSLNEQEEETETNQSSENPPETKPVMTAWPEPLPQQFKQETASQDITSNDSTKIVHVRQDDSDSAKTVSQEKCEDNDSTKSDLARPASLDMAPSSLSRNVSASHVFQRLSVTSDVPSGPEGKIVTMKHGESRRDKCLTCTHLIQGHTSAVLTLDVNGSTLYTGSQDRTIRVWDLEREEEVVCLVGQPSSVTKVVYCPKTNALFTGSQSQIKVWDLRESEFKCVKTLGQSGSDKAWKGAASSDTVHDMVLDKTGSYLYSATSSSSSVKIWDLRKFSAVGKLSGHSAPVVCLLVNEDNSETDGWVFTGSRDHYVRGFDIYNGCPTIQQPPGFTFKPPHYDGVQSLAIVGKALFSGSRDYSIKQWDIERHSLKQAINAAHSHWVTAMMKLPRLNVLVSGCRSGVIKLWTAQNCQQLGETSAHKFPINAISTCNGHILTASSDRTVKVWKVKDDVIPLQ
jgi:kinesin family protein 4/21/27